MKQTDWNTYKVTCYSHDVAQDQRSTGGIHCHQVRKGKAGWQRRIRQANGRWESFGPTIAISEQEGEAAFSTAETY